ncbi:MAG TPA: acyl-protein synthetase, partial [Polyangiaceae bacterium]|nr:acyl-protein synthetase [Polyangiaceae bacterium]
QMAGRQSESFDSLAVDIARFQFQCETGVEKLYKAKNIDTGSLTLASQIPAVPTDVFKLRRVACHPAELDTYRFLTSGTTLGARGMHPVRDADTYRRGTRAWASQMLYPDTDRLDWILLAPPFADSPHSSLGFMLDDLCAATQGQATWAVLDGRVDVDAISRALYCANQRQMPIIMAGASFAFVHLLEALQGRNLALGQRGRVMQTGGFKGKSKEVEALALREQIARSLKIPTDAVISEYGMTELGSQAYEGRWRGWLGLEQPHEDFVCPPWMRVTTVHQETLEPLPDGEIGIARIEDLTNVDSAVAVQTADRVRVMGNRFQLLGRTPGATPRGCSIGIDEILSPESLRP